MLITGDDMIHFIRYVHDFYGPNGIYDMNVTKDMIMNATMKYLTTPGIRFSGDSYDREQVRDIMIETYNLVAV
jgi:hypothetical protein